MKFSRETKQESHWRFDLIAGVSVALVALPIALALAVASGFPPLAGIVAAITGGVVSTFFRGSFVAINGPGAGMVVVLLSSVEAIGYTAVLAAVVATGVIQILLGIFRLGKYVSIFPSAVIFGMLAFVGISIFSKQIYVMMGTAPVSKDILEILQGIILAFGRMNPFIFIMALACLIILIVHSKIKSKFIHFVPAPIWVLLFSIGWVLFFNMPTITEINFLGFVHKLGDNVLIDIPDFSTDNPLIPNFSLLQVGVPDFSGINTLQFWQVVTSLTFVSSIYSIVSTKAVDKLDPLKRNSNLNKELIGLGIGTIASGVLGGLPLVTAPVQSSVNVNHNARTKWSNFIKGFVLLVLVLYASPIIQLIPYGALAAILVFTGYKLANPKIFKDNLRKGWEQFLILGFTVLASIYTNLILGVVIGALFTLLLHYLRAGLPLKSFLKYTLKPKIKTSIESEKKVKVSMKGIINFMNYLKTEAALKEIPKDKSVVMDFSHARLVDYTTLENLHNYAEKWEKNNNSFSLIGLDIHSTSSKHPYSLHVLESQLTNNTRRTRRQDKIKELAAERHWSFVPKKDWEITLLKKFPFFDSRPLEYTKNRLDGKLKSGESWAIFDTIFDEGTLLALEEFHTTVMVINLKNPFPKFTLEKEMMIDKLLDLAIHDEIDINNKEFSKNFVLKGEDKEALKSFFNEENVKFFANKTAYHIESCGGRLLIFRNLRFASAGEIKNLHLFGEAFVNHFSNKDLTATVISFL